ncbi:MAG TPA: NUDIX domain-containing protein [Candidatus Paceibacterota bacterium]|nr:NUDIX domain-containing protein [Candidatus Paceibacterota bacterium]
MKHIRSAGIVLHEGKVLLMHRIYQGKEYHTFPGGGVEEGETCEQAAVRELQEETTVQTELEKLLYHISYDNGSEEYFYRCRYLSGVPALEPDSIERQIMSERDDNFFEPLWKDLSEIPDLILYPIEVRDWFLEDLQNDFQNPVRELSQKISERRTQ